MKTISVLAQVVPDIRRMNNKGKYPLKLRLTYKRMRKYYGTGYSLTIKEWELLNTDYCKGKLRSIRNEIATLEKKALEIISRLPLFSFERFEDVYFEKPLQYKTLSKAYLNAIEEMTNEGRIGNALIYQTSINSFNRFHPNIKLTAVNTKFLKDYELWMINKGRSLTTVSIHLRTLRTIINRAIHDKYFDANSYPFGRYKYILPTGTKTKRSLDLTEIKKLFAYKPHAIRGFEERSLDFWKFSYLCNGMNIADIALLKHKSLYPEKIVYNRVKTKLTSRNRTQEIVVVRNKYIDEIIEKWAYPSKSGNDYLFGIISRNDTPLDIKNNVRQFTLVINHWMKKIGIKLGIATPITTYVARHSFSTILLRSGASVEFISESLGHSDIKTTQHYLGGFDFETKKEVMSALTDF